MEYAEEQDDSGLRLLRKSGIPLLYIVAFCANVVGIICFAIINKYWSNLANPMCFLYSQVRLIYLKTFSIYFKTYVFLKTYSFCQLWFRPMSLKLSALPSSTKIGATWPTPCVSSIRRLVWFIRQNLFVMSILHIRFCYVLSLFSGLFLIYSSESIRFVNKSFRRAVQSSIVFENSNCYWPK